MVQRRTLLPLFALLFLAAAGWLLRPPPVVEVARPVVRDVREVVVATGRLEPRRSTPLGFEDRGTIGWLFVRRGDRVVAGQPLASLDPALALQNLREAEARAETARRELERVRRGAPSEEVEKARAHLVAAEVSGRLQVRAARERLEDLRTGRAEAVRSAVAAVEQAEAALRAGQDGLRAQQLALRSASAAREQLEADLRRVEALYAAGALAAAEVERARLALERARADEEAAQARALAEEARLRIAEQQVLVAREQARLARKPGSAAQLAAARAELRALEARVEAEVRAARATLAALLRAPRPEEVRVAEARHREALAALRNARERLARTTLRAPYGGVVVDVHREVGAAVLAGEAVVTLADPRSFEVVVDLDEGNLPQIRIGQRATLVFSGGGRATAAARLVDIDPRVDPQRGTVRLRLQPLGLPAFARVGMTLDVNLEVASWPSALAVPAESVLAASSGSSVLVVQSGRVVARRVKVLGRSDRWAAVEGLRRDDLVVLDPTQTREGIRVRVRLLRLEE
ncbi:MAG: efflux RND transporter periplasmic adaptor subunit [Armatimonadota bacterium]|nr:efflux RND transporter periplasmic adaptor subunit [Armatimonadota bacterium]